MLKSKWAVAVRQRSTGSHRGPEVADLTPGMLARIILAAQIVATTYGEPAAPAAPPPSRRPPLREGPLPGM